ncbi:hypothetical protein KFK09_008778 [Dendrobium nobile]|uniref:Uncharacterized protein n=1 Tax=Dendrobium nobile TaxID=94219 RepID=A0A8T3BQH4_DENNO|nr:hypothetical protein KFK09_008778 [Dendrobium nobile]
MAERPTKTSCYSFPLERKKPILASDSETRPNSQLPSSVHLTLRVNITQSLRADSARSLFRFRFRFQQAKPASSSLDLSRRITRLVRPLTETIP